MSSREGKNWKGAVGSFDGVSFKEGEGVKKSEDVFQENIIKNFEKNNPEVVTDVESEIISDEVTQEVAEGDLEEITETEVLDVEDDLNSSSVSNFDNLKKQAKRTAAYKKKKAFVPTPIEDAPKVKGTKRNLNKNRKAVEFEDDEFKVKMPNPEDLEGAEFSKEKEPVSEKVVEKVAPKKKPKTTVELAMEKTDAMAAEYNEKKLKAEDISNSKTIDELLSFVDKTEGLQGTQEFFDAGQLRMIIEMVRDGGLDITYVTRSGGLRQKVFDLLNNEAVIENPEVVNDVTNAPEKVVDEIKAPVSVKIKPPKVIVDSDRNKPEYLNEEELQPLKPEEKYTYLKEEELQTPNEEKFKYLLEEEGPVPSDKVEKVKPDENVLEIPKAPKLEKTSEELPDLEALGLISKAPKNPKEKPKIFADDESEPKKEVETFNKEERLSQLEKNLSEKRKQLVAVHKESEILNAEYEKKMKNPFNKFLANAFGVGIKEFNKKIDGFEAVRLDYQKTVDEMVEEKILKRMDYLMSLRVNNPERKQYEPKNFADIEQYLDLKNLVGDDKDKVKELVEKSKYGNISLAEILKDKIFRKMDVDLAKRNYIFKILEKEVRDEVAVEENELIDSIWKPAK